MKEIRKRLSYANVMSTIAVFLLLGGGAAIAAKHRAKRIGTNQIKASAITTGKIKAGAIASSKLAPGAVDGSKLADGSVSTSKISGQAIGTGQLQNDSVNGEKVNESTLSEVPTAGSANPYVFAKVAANGIVDASLSKGLTSPNVSHPQTGVYCVGVSSFAPRGGQVSAGEASAQIATIAVGGSGPCPQVAVRVFTAGGAPVDGGFYLEVYR